MPKSISASTLETYHANHPVPTVLVERTNLKIVDGNKSACRFFGLTKKKLQSHQLSDFCQSSKLKIKQNKSGLSKNLGHYSFQVGDGMIEAQLVSYPLSNKRNYVVLELHRVKHDHEDIAKALFKDSKNSIILIGLDFNILAFNKLAKSIIKELFRAQLQAGTDFLQFVEPNQVGLFKRYFNVTLYGKEITRDLKIPYRDGNRWFHFSFSPFLDVAGKIIGVVYTAVDIHDKKIAEEETDRKERLFIDKEKAVTAANSQIGQLQLDALRAAMNPHFIFNALNSIQYFITQSQRENAIEFLSKFSKLIRGILDSTSGKKATIASELELIQVYVEIEQVRFEHKFDFKLTVDPIMEIETIELPALLIQPYVENAILHGLYTKEGKPD